MRRSFPKFEKCKPGQSIMFALKGLYSASAMKTMTEKRRTILYDTSIAMNITDKTADHITLKNEQLDLTVFLVPWQFQSYVNCIPPCRNILTASKIRELLHQPAQHTFMVDLFHNSELCQRPVAKV